MIVFKLIAFVFISFLLTIPSSDGKFQDIKAEKVDRNNTANGKFADLQDTWESVQRNLKSLFTVDKSNCSHSKDNDKKMDLTLPEQRTLMAVVVLPAFGIFLMTLICCLWGRMFFCKPEVPPYLTLHFPLYQNGAESRATTPIHEGQYSSLSYDDDTSSHRCP